MEIAAEHQVIVFAALSLALAYASRASLRKPSSHGFHRFIAWELMLGIYSIDLPSWEAYNDSWHQPIASCLFFASLVLVAWGFASLRRYGKIDAARDDSPMLSFEKTTALVTHGLYRHIRHPIYASLLLLCWGLFFKHPGALTATLAVIASLFLFSTARSEEQENLKYFGEEYRNYMQRSKMFLPFIL